MESVQLSFKYTEAEYVAAAHLFLWRSKETLIRIVVSFTFLSVGLILLLMLFDVGLPLWAMISLAVLVGIALFQGFIIDLPRRNFRGDPKFRDEYNLTFSSEGIRFKTRSIDASVAWSLYTAVAENEKFYLLIYGQNIASISILPKRAFRDSQQETAFRELLRRHIDHTLPVKTITGESPGDTEYSPSSQGPPDWR